jgi:hypothetical protein
LYAHIVFENLDAFRREWHQVELALSDGVQKGVEYGVKEGIDEALSTRRWKDRTGVTVSKTRGYLEMRVPGGAVGIMECDVPHASFLDQGTAPHDIYPRYASALRWYDEGGNPVFAQHVHHPGTKGDGFFGRAYLKCERVIVREIELGVYRAQLILDS